jgi:hypothetical protein
MDLQFEWEEVEAFVRQPDGSLFSWCERFHCYHHLIYGIVSRALYTNTNLSIFWCFLYIILCPEVFVSTNKQIGFYILKQSNIAKMYFSNKLFCNFILHPLKYEFFMFIL